MTTIARVAALAGVGVGRTRPGSAPALTSTSTSVLSPCGAARSKPDLEETARLIDAAGGRAAVVPTDVSSFPAVEALMKSAADDLSRQAASLSTEVDRFIAKVRAA